MRFGTDYASSRQTQLRPLAEILAGELSTAAGTEGRQVVSGAGQAGDIVLAIDRGLKAGEPIRTIRNRQADQTTDGAHTLVITDRAVSLASITVRWPKARRRSCKPFRATSKGCTCRSLQIKDWPHADYCAAMLDVGRQDHPIEAIKQMIEMCRVYKVRYLHLHLTDDQGWTFPSTKYPQLGSAEFRAHRRQGPARL